MGTRALDQVAVELPPRGQDGLARFGKLRGGGCARPMRVKSPHAHQRLNRHVEGAPGGALECRGLRQHRPQIPVHSHPLPARSAVQLAQVARRVEQDRKSTRLNSSHQIISYAVFCLKKKKMKIETTIKLMTP